MKYDLTVTRLVVTYVLWFRDHRCLTVIYVTLMLTEQNRH